jgi:ornithine cyclodeaminase/alanine dehydrogenase-like protein (mu-crystallin family)
MRLTWAEGNIEIKRQLTRPQTQRGIQIYAHKTEKEEAQRRSERRRDRQAGARAKTDQDAVSDAEFISSYTPLCTNQFFYSQMTLGKRDVAMSKQAMLPRFLLCPLLEAENVNKL